MDKSSYFHLGLIGWPLGHTLSPILHEAVLKSCGLMGEYELFPVEYFPNGKEKLEEILLRFKDGEIQGLNITIPHKQNVIPFLDSLTPCAKEIGAVNMIFQEDGELIGDNTDVEGFIIDLKQNFLNGSRNKNALVLGAGGSSRAVTYALSRDGWQVAVASRRIEQAQILANELSIKHKYDISVVPFDPKIIVNLQFNLLVNTTPVGMMPEVNKSPWPNIDAISKECFIYDLVYNPKETLLVHQARGIGLKAVNGMGMLVEQAALGFEKWTGITAPRSVMWEAVKKWLKTTSTKLGGKS